MVLSLLAPAARHFILSISPSVLTLFILVVILFKKLVMFTILVIFFYFLGPFFIFGHFLSFCFLGNFRSFVLLFFNHSWWLVAGSEVAGAHLQRIHFLLRLPTDDPAAGTHVSHTHRPHYRKYTIDDTFLGQLHVVLLRSVNDNKGNRLRYLRGRQSTGSIRSQPITAPVHPKSTNGGAGHPEFDQSRRKEF